MIRSLHNQNKMHEFFDGLEVGTRVVWIANGSEGTVQPDKTILWDDGYHMTHERMQSGDLLLIRNPKNPKRVAIATEAESQPKARVRRSARAAHASSSADIPQPEAVQTTPRRQLRPHPAAGAPPPFN